MSDLTHYTLRETPGLQTLTGQYVRLEPVDWDRHGPGIYPAILGAENSKLWDYMSSGPFDHLDEYIDVMTRAQTEQGWRTLVIMSQSTEAVMGVVSYMRIREHVGSAEVGAVTFGKALQKTREATEAMYLMARHIFDDLGYRRYEWKCDNQNRASKRAAERLGFSYEGLFRQDLIIKGRNRDTAWYSILDSEWPDIRRKLGTWLLPENFDISGRQLKTLQSC